MCEDTRAVCCGKSRTIQSPTSLPLLSLLLTQGTGSFSQSWYFLLLPHPPEYFTAKKAEQHRDIPKQMLAARTWNGFSQQNLWKRKGTGDQGSKKGMGGLRRCMWTLLPCSICSLRGKDGEQTLGLKYLVCFR